MIEIDPAKRLTVNVAWFAHPGLLDAVRDDYPHVSFDEMLISFSLLCLFQLEDVSRHSWVTQYVNGAWSPLFSLISRRFNRKSMSSVRCASSAVSMRSSVILNRKNHHRRHRDPLSTSPSSSMFVTCLSHAFFGKRKCMSILFGLLLCRSCLLPMFDRMTASFDKIIEYVSSSFSRASKAELELELPMVQVVQVSNRAVEEMSAAGLLPWRLQSFLKKRILTLTCSRPWLHSGVSKIECVWSKLCWTPSKKYLAWDQGKRTTNLLPFL